MFRELDHRILLKLSIGQRVVVDSTSLKKRDRKTITDIAEEIGCPIFYVVVNRPLEEKLATGGWRLDVKGLIEKHEETFINNEREILRGDGVATVIDTRREDFEVVTAKKSLDQEALSREGFRGLLVIGDVHGMLQSLKSAIDWATSRQLLMVFLGDVVDYGPDSLETLNVVYDLVTRGKAVMTIGNHEKKIDRWIDQYNNGDVKLNLSEGNKATVNRVLELSDKARFVFEYKFKALLHLSRHHWVFNNMLFVHGAASPEMWNISSARLTGELESLAMFGQVDKINQFRSDGYPNRIYDWVDDLHDGKIAIVGHDIRSKDGMPVDVVGKNGGRAIFLDTGSGKGGRLTAAHVMFNNGNAKIEAYTSH